MLVIWDSNGELIEDPDIMLRHIQGEQGAVNTELLPKAELIPLIGCAEEMPANGIQTENCHFDLKIGNGVADITFRNPKISGKVEISYAANETAQRISYIEDIERLKIASNPYHSDHGDFHQSQGVSSPSATDHRNILHLFYHNFKPYTYIYHIHGIIFWRGADPMKPNPLPTVANDPFVHIEYENEHEHNFGKLPYEFYNDPKTGEFRITIKNGYGLDHLRQVEDHNYGRIDIAVAINTDLFRIRHYRVYTIKVEDYIRATHKHEDESNEENPSQILYLWGDKEKMKYGPFPLRFREIPMVFQIKDKANGITCTKPHSSAPMNWADWLKIRDGDDEELLLIDGNPKIEKQKDGALRVYVKLHKTIAHGFHLHIDCGDDKNKAIYMMDSFDRISTKSDWEQLYTNVETNPEILVLVEPKPILIEQQQSSGSQLRLRYSYNGHGAHPLMKDMFDESIQKFVGQGAGVSNEKNVTVNDQCRPGDIRNKLGRKCDSILHKEGLDTLPDKIVPYAIGTHQTPANDDFNDSAPPRHFTDPQNLYGPPASIKRQHSDSQINYGHSSDLNSASANPSRFNRQEPMLQNDEGVSVHNPIHHAASDQNPHARMQLHNNHYNPPTMLPPSQDMYEEFDGPPTDYSNEDDDNINTSNQFPHQYPQVSPTGRGNHGSNMMGANGHHYVPSHQKNAYHSSPGGSDYARHGPYQPHPPMLHSSPDAKAAWNPMHWNHQN